MEKKAHSFFVEFIFVMVKDNHLAKPKRAIMQHDTLELVIMMKGSLHSVV